MPKQPKITVLLPVYNAEKYLNEAVDSILDQTFEDFELILINDGSTDNSRQILDGFKDKRIRLIENPENLGLIKTLNKGLKLAQGDYIARMDADDIATIDRFETQSTYLDNNPSCAAVGSNVHQFGSVNHITDLPTNPEEIKLNLLFENCLAHPTVMFKADIVKHNQIYYREDLLHLEDWGLWLELMAYGEIHNIKKPLLKYRLEGQNISVKHKDSLRERARILYLKYLPRYFENVDDEFVQEHWELREGIMFSNSVEELTKRFMKYTRLLKDAGFSQALIDSFLTKKKEKLFYSLADSSQFLAIKFANKNKILDAGKARYAMSKKLKRN